MKDARGKGSRIQSNMVRCSNPWCQFHAHSIPMGRDHKKFKIPELKGLSCFQISHSSMCRGIWSFGRSLGETVQRKIHDGDGFQMQNVKA